MYICVVNIELILMFKWKLWIVLFFFRYLYFLLNRLVKVLVLKRKNCIGGKNIWI